VQRTWQRYEQARDDPHDQGHIKAMVKMMHEKFRAVDDDSALLDDDEADMTRLTQYL
jgi:hypothetical protein